MVVLFKMRNLLNPSFSDFKLQLIHHWKTWFKA